MTLDNLNGSVTQFVIAAMRWSSPWWWAWTTVAATTLALLNVLPLRVPPAKEAEYGLVDVAKIGLRNVAVYALIALVFVYWPVMYVSTVSALGTSAAQGHAWFMDWVSRQLLLWCWLPIAGVVGGLALRVVNARYLTPWVSARVQRLVVRQENERQTDMR